jgi:DNA polymerase-1
MYLIDGHHQFFRAYYAIRSGAGGGRGQAMTSPVTGEPTNATFAFTGMLLKLFTKYQPTHAAIVVDHDGPTFRDDLYPAYKQNRTPPPDDFSPQIPRMIEIARLFGLQVLDIPGAEADDVLATLATRLTGDDASIAVRLVSKDKDLEQILSDRVTLFDIHEDKEITPAALLEKKGITPAQAIDYQTLIGDNIDNVPGIPGIGPKTAVKLLDQFGSVDSLMAQRDQLKGKQLENIEKAIADGWPLLTRQLVTLKRDMGFTFDQDDACVSIAGIDHAALRKVFRDLGFHKHVRDLDALIGLPSAEPAIADDTPKRPNQATPAKVGFGLFASLAETHETSAKTPPRTQRPDHDGYRMIRTREELNAVIVSAKQASLLAIDTETIGLGHDTKLAGICLSWEEHQGVYIPVRSPEPTSHLDETTVIQMLRLLLEDAGVPKCGHHIKYDLLVLRHAGVEVRGITQDSMIAAFLCNAPGIGMDDLALAELQHHNIPITELIGPKPTRKSDPPQKTMDQVDLALVTQYAAEDADITLRLCRLFEKRMADLGVDQLAREVEMPLVPVLAEMEWQGICVNPKVLDAQRVELEQRIVELKGRVLESAGFDFNIDSPKQLGDALFSNLNFPVVKKTKTGYSTDAEVLEKLDGMTPEELSKVPQNARIIPGMMIEYRMLTKLVGTYFTQLKDAISPRDGRVHCRFHQTGAATGRLSSSDPNLQNIPIRTEVGRQIRKAFVAVPGHRLISADYSQIELRILAHLSEDPALLRAFDEGADIHAAVAAEVFNTPIGQVTKEQRANAKMINFGIIYGVTAYGLARRVDSLDNESAGRLIADYRKRFAGIDAFLQRCVDEAGEHGFVRTMMGRRRVIEGIDARNPQQRALAERLAINSVVQGSAADLIKLAMVKLQHRIERERLPIMMLLQIHDELVLETPEQHAQAMSQIVVTEMQYAMKLRCPLIAEAGVGRDWFECK